MAITMRWDIINSLIKANNYKSYLEIGYYKGWSFDQVKCDKKYAVDPNPCKNVHQEQMPIGEMIGDIVDSEYIINKTTSDNFFRDFSGRKYDIIFIDGLHEAEQVYRDIQNSLKHLNEGGTIVIHDCNPPRYEHTTTGIDGCWTGDTYKAILKWIDEDLDTTYFRCVDTDWGVGILQRIHYTREIDYIPGIFQSAINNWETFDKNRKRLLNLITPEQFEEIYIKPKKNV